MKLKKILSVACALALSASLATSAFAADETPAIEDISEPTEFEYTGQVYLGVVKLTMATSGSVYLNPYGIEVKDATTGASVGTDSVTSTIGYIKNESTSGMAVSVQATAVSGNTVALVSDATADDVTAKAADVQFLIQNAADDSTDPENWDKVTSKTNLGDATTAAEDTGYVIPAPTETTNADDTVTTTPGYAAFKLTGNLVDDPQKSSKTGSVSDPWSTDDSFDLTVAFTFTPSNNSSQSPSDPDLTTVTQPTSTAITFTDGTTSSKATYTLDFAGIGFDGTGTVTFAFTGTNYDEEFDINVTSTTSASAFAAYVAAAYANAAEKISDYGTENVWGSGNSNGGEFTATSDGTVVTLTAANNGVTSWIGEDDVGANYTVAPKAA